ncbi:penicillin-binding protein [Sphingomonas koreensis]|nr:serine hydrolase domain-containing protein [Sphingomonas koreensis]RSU24807.1 penicillin-binding protein [Sphingomonas koreensis]RSU26079.1 penicillin-binding protein [Sphingomonas koreensis]RSU26093.1 penicillin-binding protein [Sphingomonas koreensis]RSU28116.1 penicillin-binding protein [Sphingomonas koreensis]RSU28130.1 penicillin-binding protein [Sphingomonas koreensis]
MNRPALRTVAPKPASLAYMVGLALLAAGNPAAARAQARASDPNMSAEAVTEVVGIFVRFWREAPVPGLAYAVVKDGRVHFMGTAGVQTIGGADVTEDTRFRIASMSKAFTALAILKLRDDGKLSLDDLAEKHVPEMRGWTYPTSDAPRIRIRDLLHHVGGLVTDDPWGDRQQVLTEDEFSAMIARGVPWSRVGQSQHEYSNYGYALLGRIVSNVSGKPYQAYIRDTILRPLGMAATTYEVGEVPKDRLAVGYRWENERWVEEPQMRDGAFGAMGGLVTTANDYAKWVAFLLSAWPARDGAETGPVKRATVREMAQGLNFVRITPRPGGAEDDHCVHATAYGMGFRVTPDCNLGLTLAHGGGYPGYGSFVVLAPETGTAAFGFANRTYQGPSVPVWQSLWALARTNAIAPRETPLNPLLGQMQDAARAAYQAGNLKPLEGKLAMNFLMDRSAENWAKEFARIKGLVGACATAEPLAPTGNLSTGFRWNCEKGKLDGQILMAPTNPPTIQALRFAPRPGN